MKTFCKKGFPSYIKFVVPILLMMHLGCKKFIEVDSPTTSVNEAIVYSSDQTATAVLTDIYARKMEGINGSGANSISLYGGLLSDELVLRTATTNQGYLAYFNNNLTLSTPGQHDFWSLYYSTIFITNAAIDGITKSNSLTPEVKQQLLGEAKFLRAFHYFYLVNLFGDVPLNLSTDYKENGNRPRTDNEVVYQQIVEDLKDAKNLLSENYKNATLMNAEERVRPNKFTAMAMLARVYLYHKDYADAETESTAILSNKALYDTVQVENVFIKNSKETIWSLQPTGTGVFSNTSDGRFFVITALQQDQVSIRNSFAETFDSKDKRKSWIGTFVDPTLPNETYYYAQKYRIGSSNSPYEENSVVFRVAEQYLIRAEARAMQNNVSGALEDLNLIRKRARLAAVSSNDPATTLNYILDERRFEFFSEWGHRWFDLKRTGKATSILQPLKGDKWQETDLFLPIPKTELENNQSIQGHQNPGYGS